MCLCKGRRCYLDRFDITWLEAETVWTEMAVHKHPGSSLELGLSPLHTPVPAVDQSATIACVFSIDIVLQM